MQLALFRCILDIFFLEYPMDDIDQRIVLQLQANGRLSNRQIARQLEQPEKQVGSRIRSMLERDDLRILVVTDIFAAGFDFMLFIGIEVAGRPASEVGEELAALEEVLSVMLTMGSCDIEIVVVAEDHATLENFVRDRLAMVEGVRSYSLGLGLRMHKYTTAFGPLMPSRTVPMRIPSQGPLDNTDRSIIGCLMEDARSTNLAIASAVGISESAVRTRINALKDHSVIRITAMRSMRIENGQVFASIGLEVAGRDQKNLIAELTEISEIGFVATVLGRYDILAMVLLDSAAELGDLLTNRIEMLPGVRKVHSSQVLRFIKFDPHWTAVMDREQTVE